MKPVIFDIDGVLADFTMGFTTIGNKKFGTDVVTTAEHVCWNHLGGMTKEQQRAVWKEVRDGSWFWSSLPRLVPLETFKRIACLMNKCDVYFVTHRDGLRAKEQTEAWLGFHLRCIPTVILSKRKGEIARAVNAGYAIEDKAANASCIAWMTDDQTKSYLIDRPYNQCDAGFLASSVRRVTSVEDFLHDINEGL